MKERCNSLNDKLFGFVFAVLALVDGVEVVRQNSIIDNIITNIELVIMLKMGEIQVLTLCILHFQSLSMYNKIYKQTNIV